MKITDIEELKNMATTIRKGIIEQVYSANSGHPGGSLSIADILTVLYFNELNIDEKNPKWEDRDRMILSKGHCSPALYSCLANRGFFDKEELKKFRNINSRLQGHPDMNKVLGVDMTTGSLGQGISAAVGVAIGLQRKNSERKVYCIVGDGELNEGQCWEAIQFAAHNRLKNFTLFIDDNKKQLDGTTEEICNPFDFIKKMESFGFETIKVNGASVEEIDKAVSKDTDGRPKCIVLDTIKGQGVEYFENLKANHHIRFTDEMKEILKSEIAKLDIE